MYNWSLHQQVAGDVTGTKEVIEAVVGCIHVRTGTTS
jgi:hypothetical protein